MITKEQYEKIVQHCEALKLFEIQGAWVGGDELFELHQQITGEPKQNCGSCKGRKLIDLINMIRLYEERYL